MIDKVKEIHKRRNFQSFWECVDYLTLASYDEIESIMGALEVFEGNVWGNVITAAKGKPSVYNGPSSSNTSADQGVGNINMMFASGGTYTYALSGTSVIGGVDTAIGNGSIIIGNGNNITNWGINDSQYDEDDLYAQIFIITDKGNNNFKDLYKAYIETKKYAEVPALEGHYKIVTINLKSELAIRLFNDGYSKFK